MAPTCSEDDHRPGRVIATTITLAHVEPTTPEGASYPPSSIVATARLARVGAGVHASGAVSGLRGVAVR
jgi:hypothetical protein